MILALRQIGVQRANCARSRSRTALQLAFPRQFRWERSMNKQLDIRRAAKGLPATGDLWMSFREELDNLFDRFSGGFETYALKPLSDLEDFWSKSFDGFAPLAVDVAETDKAYVITAELPGVDEKD